MPKLGINDYPGVFIRAPRMIAGGRGCQSLCEYDKGDVLIREGDILAASFHPELTDDTRVHEYFLGMI
jgi:pyridoxal 5'-phosphate synthase pdxT subunit